MLFAGLDEAVVFHVFADVEVVGAYGDAVVEREHGHGHGADEPSACGHPVVGIAGTYAGLREFELAYVVHQYLQQEIAGVGEADARVVVHGSGHERACRVQLLERLVVGCGVGEALAVEHIVGVEEEGAHAQRVVGAPVDPVGIVFAFGAYLGLARAVSVDAQVDAVAASCGAE